jgi:hypothetical protein
VIRGVLGCGPHLSARRDLPLDAHCSPQEVDILDPERRQFADPQAEPRPE